MKSLLEKAADRVRAARTKAAARQDAESAAELEVALEAFQRVVDGGVAMALKPEPTPATKAFVKRLFGGSHGG